MEHVGALEIKTWCMSEVDIFRDLSPAEMDAIAAAAPMKTYAAGELLFSPHNPVETLFILKRGRVRVFRVSVDGRALTTAIITPGTIFGEMVLLGQHMYNNFAEALDETVVCVMSRSDVHRLLLSDPRIAARITEILGNRLVEMERRLSDSVFKSVPQRVAGTLGDTGRTATPVRRGTRLAGRRADPRADRGAGRHIPGDRHQSARRLRRPGTDPARARTHHRPRHCPDQRRGRRLTHRRARTHGLRPTSTSRAALRPPREPIEP